MGNKFSVTGRWVYGYLTKSNDLIAPVVINANGFPVGAAVFTEEHSALLRVNLESNIQGQKPIEEVERVTHFQIGESLNFQTYAGAVLHMYRMAVKSAGLDGIKGVAESEFRAAKIFIDPPMMQLSDKAIENLRRFKRVKRLRDVFELNVAEVIRGLPA